METNAKLTEKLFLYVSEFCAMKPATISRETMANDIGLDSLSLTQILAGLESEFAFELQEENVTKLLEARTMGDYADVLTNALERWQSRDV